MPAGYFYISGSSGKTHRALPEEPSAVITYRLSCPFVDVAAEAISVARIPLR